MTNLETTSKDDFLWWLRQYVGSWRTDAGEYLVYRGGDGWLEALSLPGCARVPLEAVLRTGTQTEMADTLGPRPIALSQRLMEAWLTPGDMAQLRGAWHVSIGRDKIVERIKQRIEEFDVSEQKRRWLRYWSGAGSQGPRDADADYMEKLKVAFLAEGGSRDE